jgi:hypothetical protein
MIRRLAGCRSKSDGEWDQGHPRESRHDEGVSGRYSRQRQAFPEGSKIVKIEWSKKNGPASPYFVEVPDALKSVSFIEKDSKKFKDSSGWGYAQLLYDAGLKR